MMADPPRRKSIVGPTASPDELRAFLQALRGTSMDGPVDREFARHVYATIPQAERERLARRILTDLIAGGRPPVVPSPNRSGVG